MTIEDEIAFLERVPILRRLGEAALRSLAIAAAPRSLQPGEILFTVGEIADGAFIVQQGALTLKGPRAGEAEIVAEPGTLLGEAALLAETKRPATATARENCTVLRLSRATFLKILDSYPEAALRLRELIAARSDRRARDIESVRAALARAGKTP
jgi:CRP-like cAMP-binding protein